MRQRLFGIFSSIDDAKAAAGQIKKESWNLADLTIIYSNQEHENLSHPNRNEDDYELAAENFLEDPEREPPPVWPGLKEEYLEGIGPVRIGSQTNQESLPGKIVRLAGSDLPAIEREIQSQKVVAMIEVEPEVFRKVRHILEKSGAEILESQAEA